MLSNVLKYIFNVYTVILGYNNQSTPETEAFFHPRPHFSAIGCKFAGWSEVAEGQRRPPIFKWSPEKAEDEKMQRLRGYIVAYTMKKHRLYKYISQL